MEVEMPNDKIDQLIDVLEKQEIEVITRFLGYDVRRFKTNHKFSGHNANVHSIIC